MEHDKNTLMKCSPGNQMKQNDITCLNKLTLIAIANHFCIKINKNMSKNNIYLKIIQQLGCLDNTIYPETDVLILNQKYFVNCLQDNLVLSQNKQLVNLINQNFRPYQPQHWKKNPHSWLSNIDIYNVLIQYQKYYKKFMFLGVFPINFDVKDEYTKKCVYETACRLNKQFIEENKCDRLGVVFNLSYHHQKGSHWVALFALFNKNQRSYIFYYDSCVGEMRPYIKKFIQQICKYQDQPSEIHIYENTIRHQKYDTECGMFCIHYITNILDISYQYQNSIKQIEQKYNQFLGQQQLNDNFVFNLRNFYFNE